MTAFRTLLLRMLAFGALLLCALPAQAQDEPFEEGRTAYLSADFDGAIVYFQQVVQNEAAPLELREEALKYLGRIYIAKDAVDDARQVVAELLELEPPLVELDPDVEPLPLMKVYYEMRKEYEGDYGVEKEDPGIRTLAVMDFTNNSIDEHERFDPMRQGFASMMINYLGGATDLKVVERERLQWLLSELDLQRSSYVDQSSAVRTGKLLGAHAVLFGSYTVHRKQIQMSVRLVEVETGEILLAEQILGKKDDFFELVEKLSLQAAHAINSSLEETTVGARTETRSLDAQLSYSEALSELDRGNYHAAAEKLEEALEYDPGFDRARSRLEGLQPMLVQVATTAPVDG